MFTLITAATTAQAYQLEKLIPNKEQIIFADSFDLPQVMLKAKRFIKIPQGDSFSFAHLLLSTCLDHQITTVYPLRRTEILALAQARLLFDEYGISIITPAPEEIPLLLDKGIKGEIIIHNSSSADLPGRGVFLKSTNLEYQLFTAD
ncbi:MAG: hypothetical protein H7Y07_12750 [Pyrinomonadaceae bacterium]|nr:hypothetical protein [Sphingobacteriaceae bacterium]